MKRPTSVTVIVWILIVTGGISLVASTVNLNNPMVAELMAKSPLPMPVQYLMLYAGFIITLISGLAMLRAQNWARFLYVAWSAFAFVVGLATSPMKAAMIPGLVVFAVIVFLLFREKANDYFSSNASHSIAQGA